MFDIKKFLAEHRIVFPIVTEKSAVLTEQDTTAEYIDSAVRSLRSAKGDLEVAAGEAGRRDRYTSQDGRTLLGISRDIARLMDKIKKI
jgi:hypothetical protein